MIGVVKITSHWLSAKKVNVDLSCILLIDLLKLIGQLLPTITTFNESKINYGYFSERFFTIKLKITYTLDSVLKEKIRNWSNFILILHQLVH
jgi:hypothetical protein